MFARSASCRGTCTVSPSGKPAGGGGELAFRFTSLRRTIRSGLGTKARMIRLPARQEDAERLLDGLAH